MANTLQVLGFGAEQVDKDNIYLHWSGRSDRGTGNAYYLYVVPGVGPAPTDVGAYVQTMPGPVSYTWNARAAGYTSGTYTLYLRYRNEFDEIGPANTGYTVTFDTSSPGAPPSITATRQSSANRMVNVSWGAAANTEDVFEYLLYRSTSSAVQGIQIYNGTSLSYQDTAPSDGIYYYQVRSTDVWGNNSVLTVSSGVTVTMDQPPSTPPTPSANLSGNTVTVSGYGVSGATSYNIYRNGAYQASTTSTVFVDTVTYGSYYYSVAAVNNAGTSAQSGNSSTVTYSQSLPATPPTPMAALSGNTVTISGYGVSGATGYNIYRNGVHRTTVSLTTYSEGVSEGSYSYQVSAINGAGTSSLSGNSNTVTYSTTPDPGNTDPAKPVIASVLTNGTDVTVSWDAAANAVSYEVYRNGSLLAVSNTQEYEDTVPSDGTFTYGVVALNTSSVKSAMSDLYSVDIYAEFVPVPQLSVSATGLTVSVSWTSVPDALEYVLLRNEEEISRGTSQSYSETLTAGTYTYEVYATGPDETTSGYSDPSVIKVNSTLVAPELDYFALGTSIELVWTAVSNATTYQLERNGVVIYSGTALSYVVHEALGTNTYRVQVIGNNTIVSVPGRRATTTTLTSNEITPPAVVAPTPLSAPSVTATVDAGDVELSWTDVGADMYEISRDGEIQDQIPDLVYTDANLLNGQYSYTVRGQDEAGNWGAYSDPAVATVVAGGVAPVEGETPVAPASLSAPTVVVNGLQVSVTWSAYAGADEYVLTRDGEIVYQGANLSFSETLTSGTHTYALGAIDANDTTLATSVNVDIVLAGGTADGVGGLGRLPLSTSSLGRKPDALSRPMKSRDF